MESSRGVMFAIFGALAIGVTPVVSQRIQTVELENSRYHISNASPYSPQLNWYLAYQYCRTLGMQLLAISTKEEADMLTDFLIENNYMASDYWTSGNQLGDQMWIWMSTGQPFNSTWNAWSPSGPPQGANSKKCVSQIKGIWSAQNCDDSKHFICEQNRCFYYNYVTTNRGGSQGAAQPTQGSSLNNSNRRPTRIRVSQRKQPLSSQPVRKQSVDFHPTRHNPIRNQPIRSQMFRNQSIINNEGVSKIMNPPIVHAIQFSTTNLPATTPSTSSTVMPFKFMTMIPNDIEETTITPTTLDEESKQSISEVSTESNSVTPTLSPTSEENLILREQEPKLNEIQTDLQKEIPIALSRILLPPTRSFSPVIQNQKELTVKDTSTSTGSFEDEVQRQKDITIEDSHDPSLMMLLGRREPVSWA